MQIEDIVREGTVTAVNESKRIAKVWFDGLEIESDWLPVLITRDRIGSDVTEWDETQWTEFETEWKGNRAGDPDYVDHKHKLVIKPYMPKVNDLVLVLYFPVFNGDGVILGGVKPWR